MECFLSPLCSHRLMEPGGHVPPIVLGCVGGSFPTHSLGSTGGQAGLLLHQLGEVRGLRG